MVKIRFLKMIFLLVVVVIIMSCYHPHLMVPVGFTDSGKTDFKMLSEFDRKDYLGDWILDHMNLNPGSVVVPCGKCLGCRLDYSRSWADRMMLELETAGKGIFITLTYDNEHVPILCDDVGEPYAFTLKKKDCQLFMKRLRKKFEERRIRFYLAGEYGPTTSRPHYHAILFGIGLDDFPDVRLHGRNELGQEYYISDLLTSLWSCGFALVSGVTWKTCAYVARYVTKKIGSWFTFDTESIGIQPEFSLMSRRPGLGHDYLDVHPDCLDFQSINLTTPEGGLKLSIPKYYFKQLELTDFEKYATLKAQRKEFAEDRMLLKLQKTGLSYLDYLEVEENEKIEKVKSLKRDRVY